MDATSAQRKPFLRFVRWFMCAVGLMLLAAAVVPNLVKARWTSSGVRFTFEFEVTDANTRQPVRGASVVVSSEPEPPGRLNPEVEGFSSATSDERGECRVHTWFPGSGSGSTGKLKVWQNVYVRCEGYEPWSNPCHAILGETVIVTNGPSGTHTRLLKVALTRRKEPQQAP